MYQYYNTEPKNDAFAKKGKITKEEVPAVTQLFTPDWIVRYMVENSLGRLWVEGHPDADLQGRWKYYLEEAEQEPEVQAELAKIREEYAKLKPEDIKLIDPCMGSGHILVYAFDVFMQIYENAGWSAREAAQSIVEHNIYGLDIDDRAAQLSYFAVMMKAHQYDRRIFTRGVRPNVYAIQESNGINREQLKYFGSELDEMEKNTAILQIEGLLDTLIDAKEYGSILNVDEYDWDLLRRWVNGSDMGSQITFDTYGLDETAEKLKELIEIGAIMAQKYEVVATNPPYAGTSNLSPKLNLFVAKTYKDEKADLYTVFINKCRNMVIRYGFQTMITQHGWMFQTTYEKMRISQNNIDLVNMAHLGPRAFEEISGEVVQSTTFVYRKSHVFAYKGIFSRLVDATSQQQKEKEYLCKNKLYEMALKNFERIPGNAMVYWVSNKVMELLDYPKLQENVTFKEGLTTANNELFLRLWFEIPRCEMRLEAPYDDHRIWIPYNKGGSYRKWYGNNYYVVNWENNGKRIKEYNGSSFRNADFQLKEGGTYSALSNDFAVRYSPAGYAFDSKGTMLFTENLSSVIAYLNSKLFSKLVGYVCPTLDFRFGTIQKLPNLSTNVYMEKNVELCKADWDSFEISWDFKRHPLLSVIPRNSALFADTDNIDLAECYTCWENECNERFNQLKASEEELNRIFIDIYGLQDELTPEVDDKDVTVRKADLQRDIKSLISYAVGCMFGRYSMNEEGLVYAGGEWDDSKYTTFIPDVDNIIPITDEEYLEDDIISRFCTWVKTAFGAKSLETNLDFIAKALGNKGDTSREIIRNYFLNDFFKDHCNTYSVTGSGKRPIYWLFDSGKQNGFKALVYLHRYNADTIGNVRVDYLYRMQRVYESEIGRMQDTIDNSKNSREVSLATKRKEKLQKQLKECREYDEKIGHLALARIELDLDDGVKVNYRKVQTAADGKFYEILADSKNIMAKEK